MELHLLSDVRQVDGPSLGELRHVVCDSKTKKVFSLVVQESGFDGRAVIVPAEFVAAADDDAVSLRMDETQLHSLEPYAYSQNVAPPPADVADDIESADYKQEFVDVPNVPPVGAAQGITTIAFTPIVEVWRNVPAGSAVIGDKTVVAAQDGDVGDLERLVVDDESLVITSLVVESNGLATHMTEIPADLVERIQSGRIDLSPTLAEIRSRQKDL